VKRQLILAGIIVFSLAMAMSPSVLGFTTYTSSQRETISIIGGHMTASIAVPGALHYDRNDTLPFALGDFNVTLTKISVHVSAGIPTLNWVWNNHSGAYAAVPHWANITLVGLNMGTRKYSHINLTSNSTHWNATISYYLTNVADMNSFIVYKETDKATPKIDAFWAVNDTANFTLPFEVDTYLKIGYPDNVVGSPSPYPTTWANGTVNDDDVFWVNYQKYGPAYDLDTSNVVATVTGASHEVAVTFDSTDKLDNADWSLDTTDAAFSGAFDTLVTTSLVITINDHVLPATDWSIGSIDMKKVDISKADDQTAIFTWTAAGGGGGTTTPPATTAPNVLTEEAVAGVPNWALGAVIIIICIAGYMIWKNEKK
jgi:hypothetical protein